MSATLESRRRTAIAPEELRARMETSAVAVEALLDRALDDRPREGERFRPPRLTDAMRHGTLNGGKRLRPFLLVESARAVSGEADEGVARVAAALECIHCYSLIHDDLPAMDDDDLRRGRPTVHRAYDDATAILAGDALMTIAFDLIASRETALPDAVRAELVAMLSRASGVGGMAGGQMLDLLAESDALDENGVMRLQAMKTGALIRFACEGGAVAGGAGGAERDALRRFGETVGLAFQLADDLLDVTQTAEAMGKATGKDAGQGKGTLVALRGIDWTRERLDTLVGEAEAILEPFGSRGDVLRATARFVARRDH